VKQAQKGGGGSDGGKEADHFGASPRARLSSLTVGNIACAPPFVAPSLRRFPPRAFELIALDEVMPDAENLNSMSTHQSTRMIDDRFHYGAPEHAFYETNGYHLFDHFLTDDAVAECRGRIDAMLNRLHPEVPPDEMIGTHQQGPWVFELATQQKVLDMIERQIGPDIVLWATHLLCKPPRTGQLIPWHQDAPYWNVKGRFGASAWIAFDDIDEDNGAMSVVPQWHRRGTLPIQDSQFVKGFTQEIVPSALPEDVGDRRVAYIINAGRMAIHDVMIPHNSPPNVSDRWRRVLVLRYIAADAEIGPKTYTNYTTGEPFEREPFLVRGRDVKNLGLRCHP